MTKLAQPAHSRACAGRREGEQTEDIKARGTSSSEHPSASSSQWTEHF